ncbi:MAG: hypothetical protein H0T46_07215 [Deltaproteobacteria bacterium]|nr:hypothetical protein [Deltaproteobacteria bacterium]
MKPILLFLTTALVLLLSAPREAEAKGIVIINTGRDILYMHDVPEAALEQLPELAGYKVGYKYSMFGVFWLDFWRWDGELVVYKDTEYAPIPASEQALFGAGSAPIGYHAPPGLLLVLCGILLAIASALKRNRKLMIGLTVGTAAGTAALYFMGLGLSTIIPASAAVGLLVMTYGTDDSDAEPYAE